MQQLTKPTTMSTAHTPPTWHNVGNGTRNVHYAEGRLYPQEMGMNRPIIMSKLHYLGIAEYFNTLPDFNSYILHDIEPLSVSVFMRMNRIWITSSKWLQMS